jgi:hypothetical protein
MQSYNDNNNNNNDSVVIKAEIENAVSDTEDLLPTVSMYIQISETFNFVASYIYSSMFNIRKIREIPLTLDVYETKRISHKGVYVKYFAYNSIKCMKNVIVADQKKYFILYKSHLREFKTVITCNAYDINNVLNEIATHTDKFKQIILNKPSTMIVKIVLTTDGNTCDITHMFSGIIKHTCDIFITDILIGHNTSYNTNSFITTELFHNFVHIVVESPLSSILDKDITKIFTV